MKKSIIKYINSRFNMHYTPNGRDDTEFLKVLKEQVEAYFGMPLDARIKSVSTEIDLIRYIREELVIDIDATEYYVSNPTTIEIKKELQGYTLIVRIRGLDHNKMLGIARLAGELIELQDTINYGEE